jgi:transitional endoplasmic reticulum ATPase
MDVVQGLIGRLVKVISSNEETRAVHVRTELGLTQTVEVPQGNLPDRGDVMLLGEKSWQAAPHDAWTYGNDIGIVRRLLDDGEVLIEDGASLKRILNLLDLGVSINNTVEFNIIDGIVRVLSEEPIRIRDQEIEPAELLQEYRVDTSGKGPGFEDFGGYPHVIERARELIETQLERGAKLKTIGVRPVKGVLFTGPPGTGKTHLARIIAHQSGADFFRVSGPTIVSKWLGDTEGTLRKIFEAAITSPLGRAIIFFDEIDSIAERRTGETHEASKRLVAQLLTLMDGFDDKSRGLVVIAATNRVETLDPALTRPGRFDWEIEFGLPTLEDRLAILEVSAKGLQTKGDLGLEDVATMTPDWSAAELSSIWTEAGLIAAGDNRESIAGEDVAQAFERVVRRPRRRNTKEDGA